MLFACQPPLHFCYPFPQPLPLTNQLSLIPLLSCPHSFSHEQGILLPEEITSTCLSHTLCLSLSLSGESGYSGSDSGTGS